ncbi:MAG: hypothetical protein ABSD97_11330 [Acidimicrobiales bacterium]|jgi:hypothetical protein
MTKANYAVDNIEKPNMLVRLSGADTSETLSANKSEWTSIPSLVNWFWDSDGRLIAEDEARRIARNWGATLPD